MHKPPEPNAVVVSIRRKLLDLPDAPVNKLAAASDPLDLAKHKGWLTDEQHQAAEDFCKLYRTAGNIAPGFPTGDMDKAPRGHDSSDGNLHAAGKLKAIHARLHSITWAVLVQAAVHRKWPAWIAARLVNGAESQDARMERRCLIHALDVTARECGIGRVAA